MAEMTSALAPRKAPSKVPTKVPAKDIVKSKIPSKIPVQVPSVAPTKSPMKALDAAKVPSAAATSKVPPAAGVGSKVPVSRPVAKKASTAHAPARFSSKLPPQQTTPSAATAAATAARVANGADGATRAVAELSRRVTPPVIPSPSEATTDGTEYFATYDKTLSSIETPREQTANESTILFGGKQDPHKPQPKSKLQRQGLQREEEEKQITDPNSDTEEALLLPASLIVTNLSSTTAKPVTRGANLEQQLVKAEERIGLLTQELEVHRKAVFDTHSPTFVQHSFQLEEEVDELKQELAKERESARYHREAHMNALMEIGHLRQEIDSYGTRTTLMKRNAEIEANMSDMAREKVELELVVMQMQEDAAALGEAHGNSGFGSGYVTVRLSSLCTSCREKIRNEADRRATRDRLSQLVQPKLDGSLSPPSLAEHWPPQLQRQLLENWRDPPPLSTSATVNSTDALSNNAISHGTNGRVNGEGESFGKRAMGNGEHVRTAKPEGLNTASTLWRELRASDGRVVYYNTVTNNSTFERPAALK